jgi:hypothetical protein
MTCTSLALLGAILQRAVEGQRISRMTAAMGISP